MELYKKTELRASPIWGILAIGYLVAELYASESIGVIEIALAVAGLGLSLVPWALRYRPDGKGVSWLALASSALVVSTAPLAPKSLILAVVAALAQSAVGATVLYLSLSLPTEPAWVLRRPWIFRVVVGTALFCALMACLSELPWLSIGSFGLAVPARWRLGSELFLALSLLASIAVRFASRRRVLSFEEANSASWLSFALGAATVCLGLSYGVERIVPGAGRLFSTTAWISIVGAHFAVLRDRPRLDAGPLARELVVVLTTLVIAVATGLGLHHLLQFSIEATLLGSAVSFVIFERLVGVALRRLLIPNRAQLLDALQGSISEFGGANFDRVEDLARTALHVLRMGAGTNDAHPILFTTSPGREFHIAPSGEVQAREREIPPALLAYLQEHVGELLLAEQVEANIVRGPEMRALADTLRGLDALCVVPLVAVGEVDAALIVPRAGRRARLSLEEQRELRAFGERVYRWLSVLCALRRAQDHALTVQLEFDRLRDELEVPRATQEGARDDAHAGVLRQDSRTPPIAYSDKMRALMSRVAEVAPLQTPIALIAEAGDPVEPIALTIHHQSGRKGPLLVVDCVSGAPESLAPLLMGEEADGGVCKAGWLELASGGTLVLLNLPALPVELQRALAESIATREVRRVGGRSAVPADVRFVAGSRLKIAPLVEANLFDSELGRWLAATELSIPPLRERHEDLRSLVLMTLDKASRKLGRGPVGIEADAMQLLLAYAWPGNTGELDSVIERAVAKASGIRVNVQDLGLAGMSDPVSRPAQVDTLDDTYQVLERRILQRALVRARGNKSEAARLLDLKRSTFVDKLRRHQLDDEVDDLDAVS